MMMEDSGDDDNGSMGGDMSDGVGSSDPPSFAVPPGGMPDDTRSSDDGMISDSRSVTPTPPAASAPVPATDDPFDFLSMTTPPSISRNNENTAVSGAGVFDVFASDNNNNDLLGSAIPSSQIDMDSQQSMIGGTAVQTSGVVPTSPRELQTAESGDLLGLGGDSPRNQPPPDDLMDSNFQTMPVSAPVSTTIDPFDMNNNNNNVFLQSAVAAPGNIAASSVETNANSSLAPTQKQPPEQESSQQQPTPASTSDSNVVENDEIQPKEDSQNPLTSVQNQASNNVADASPVEAPNETATNQEAPSPPVVSMANPSPSDTTKHDTAEKTVDAPATTPNDDDVVPNSPSPSGEDDMLEEPLEEVELVSPQQSVSVEEDGDDNNKIAQQKEAALQIKSLKPPLTEEENSASSSTQALLNQEQEKKLQEMQEQLSKAQQQMERLQKQKDQIEHQHNDSQRETANVLQELQNKLQEEVSKRGEAENDAIVAKEEIQSLQKSLQKKEEEWKEQTDDWKQQLGVLEKENEDLVTKARQELEDRKEHERRERVLANKLNMLKKAQTTKTDVEEVYEDDLRLLKEEVDTKTKRIEELESSEASLKEQLEKEKAVAETRIEKLEKTVREEKALNEERKKKMKAFIESKVDELKEAKAESEHYQNELNSTNQAMIDMNNRWKTLHAQWVQSQTRNRELQRDLNKIKNDSENLHKVGDSLNVKLSKSANEMEQHKSKRMAAKQELMSVLGQLEAEREITNKLRDSVRFTFTPKAQSQHQLLQENLSELDKQLEVLARRLGRPIPLSNDVNNNSLSSLVMSAVEESERSEHDGATPPTNGNQDGKGPGPTKEQKRILMETTRLLGKLENETQRISQGIMALSSAIEQMNQLIVGGGEKTCFTSLGGIFFGGGLAKALESDRSRSGAAGSRAAPVRYGHSSHFPSESGTMT